MMLCAELGVGRFCCFDKHLAGVRRFWRFTYIITYGPQCDYDILTHSVSWY